jgi:hypothetical protein
MTEPSIAPAGAEVPDLAPWLQARYDGAEVAAKAATPGPWCVGESGEVETVAQYGTPGYERPLRVTQDAEGITAAIDEADAVYVAALDPSWRLADIAAKRAILAEHPPAEGWNYGTLDGQVCGRCCGEDSAGGRVGDGPYPCRTVRLLAAEFCGEPGYLEAWRPE